MKKNLKLVVLTAFAALMVGCGQQAGSSVAGDSVVPTSSAAETSSAKPMSSIGESSQGGDSTGRADSSTVIEDDIEESEYAKEEGTVSGRMSDKGKFYSDYGSFADEQLAAKELAIDIAAEGDVLLKNDNALPLASYEKHITLLGMHSVDLVTAGGGSGAGTTGNNGVAFTGMVESLEDAGLQVNPVTVDLYNTYKTLGTINNELPISRYTSSTIASYYGYSDAAVITLSRQGTENKDIATCKVEDHANEDDHTLQLDDNEAALIKHAKQYFSKVIVVINSSNIMQIPELAEEKTEDNYGVDAILWVGGVGNNGADAIGRILTGEVNPSGHTSDLWSKDFKKDPTWTNFGWQNQNKNADGSRMDAFMRDENGNTLDYSEVEYREGIYHGYRYYETKATDMGDQGEAWYNENVLFPYGYGLSYTTFDWEWAGVSKSEITAGNQTVTVKVKVTNTGSVAGKDVVQVYYSAPYTKGGIEKASNNLVNFGKTKLLNPGESDIVTVQFVAQDMASFDYNDANNNGFQGYELEKGNYTITANRDSHHAVLSTTKVVPNDLQLQTDYMTGKDINPIFSEDDDFNSTSESLLNNSISRANGLEQPAPASVEDRKLTADEVNRLDDQDIYNHSELQESDPYYVASTPAGWNQGETNGLKIADMSGIDYQELAIGDDGSIVEGTDADSQKWSKFMNELSWKEMADIVSGDNVSGPSMGALDDIAMDANSYKDGPVQISGGALFPSAPITAATFNTTLAQRMGRMVGNDAIWLGLSQWAGPAMDTHRSPFSGRNFEYYSEDGFHAARIAAAAVSGAVSKGLITYCKHFFLNDQESYRADYGGVMTFATEQTIREQYLKPFEWAMKVGHSMGAMSSFNRIGFEVTACSYAVHQELLRDEWNSKACTCTDAWAKDYVPVNRMAYAGDDQLLGQSSSYAKNAMDHGTWDETAKMVKTDDGTGNMIANPSFYYAVRSRAQRALFARANSTTVKNGVATGATYNVVVEKGVPNAVEITSEDANFTIADTEAAKLEDFGLSLSNGKVITGKATSEGSVTIAASVKQDNWISSTANINVIIKSAVHVNDEAMSTGTSVASYAPGANVSMKVQVPALEYFSEIEGGYFFWGMTMNAIVVNSYKDSEGNWKQRNEDKTAADIITMDYNDAVEKLEYNYAVTDLPDGLTARTVMKTVQGKANKGSYEVPDYVMIEGTAPTAAADYTFNVDLTYYTRCYMMSWIMTFAAPAENHYTGAVTFTVA